jgi:hypothetical protein
MSIRDCHGFREALSRALEGLPVPPGLAALSWHEHLLGCQVCRELLEREEALEVLLATLPDPKLPPELTRRLVARLAEAREDVGEEELSTAGLDSLLDLSEAQIPAGMSARVLAGLDAERSLDALLALDPEPVAPSGLGARVLAGLGRGEEAQLDRLLDLDGSLTVPEGLSRRVLEGLALDRRRVVPRLRLLRSAPLYAAAAGLVLAALGWTIWSASQNDIRPVATHEEVASGGLDQAEPDPDLLAVLDMLENDSLWNDTVEGAEVADSSEDLPLLLADTLDSGDEILLAFLDD